MIEIPLTQGQVALIDDEDCELVSRHKWYANWSPYTKTFYSVASFGKRKRIKMHRLILNPDDDEHVDHINQNTLDNRRCNIRTCTIGENLRNRGLQSNSTSGRKGVTWHKASNKWAAQIQLNKKKFHLGLYNNEEDAYKAYCTAALRLHGEFARLS